MDRAKRRFYAERRKAQAKKFWRFRYLDNEPDTTPDVGSVGFAATTPQSCSRHWCCGNKRGLEGLTIKERKQLTDFRDQLKDNEI